MSKKKVLFITINDWANSGFKMTEAVNRNSEKYEVKYFALNEHPFGYKRDNVLIDKITGQINHQVLNELEDYSDACDIIHCKENSGFVGGFEHVSFDLGKPIVQTFGGSVYRSHHEDIRKAVAGIVNVFTVTTPDLIFSNETLVPFAIDTEKYYPVKKSEDCIIIGHSPTNAEIKGTNEILEAIANITQKYNHVFMNMQHGLAYYYAIELKRINHIFIDQFKVNAYGNSAVEAMAYGSAVLAGTNSGAEGVIDFNAESLIDELDRLVSDKYYLSERQDESLAHCIKTHSYSVISEKMDKIYDRALIEEKIQ